MAPPHPKTASVGAGRDEGVDEEIWEAFDALIEASRPEPDFSIKTMVELMEHYGQSRNQVRKWLTPAIEEGKAEKVTTYREASDGSMRPIPGYRILSL